MKVFKYLFLLALITACKNETKSNSEILVESETVATEQSKEAIAKSKNFKLLQGSWQNTLDTLSVIKINGDIIENFYSGISAGPGVKISLGDRCLVKPDPSRASEVDRYISIAGNYTDCYYISKLDEESLFLNFLNGGFDLTFKRL